MAWSVPVTAVANAPLTGAQWNASVRDNLLETAPAKFTAAGQVFVSTGNYAGAARTPTVDQYSGGGADATNSTSYIAMGGGPLVTVTTGAQAIVFHGASLANDTSGARTWSSFEVFGGSPLAPSDINAIWRDQETANRSAKSAVVVFLPGLTPGSNIFASRCRVSAGTGTITPRNMVVFPL